VTSEQLEPDAQWMRLALTEAQAADAAGEVPVGAVVVLHGRVIATGRNAPISTHDPSAHAEMVALRTAAQHLGNYRLDDCELYVTLEPCTMCAGAMLHARLKRVVYGATDPKTGAAGSVLDVFGLTQLNHQTQVRGGVMGQACAELLQNFFKRQRRQQRQERARTGMALREDALRTPEFRFADLPEIPAMSCYVNDLPSLTGLRLHYLDTGAAASAQVIVCLHGPQSWSYGWRSLMAEHRAQGHRVVCPDLIGFGKSDKPKKMSVHSLSWHAQILLEWLTHLDLHQVIFMVSDTMLALAQQVQAAAPMRVSQVIVAQADLMSAQALAAPFPDAGHRAALRAFSSLKIQSLPPEAETPIA